MTAFYICLVLLIGSSHAQDQMESARNAEPYTPRELSEFLATNAPRTPGDKSIPADLRSSHFRLFATLRVAGSWSDSEIQALAQNQVVRETLAAWMLGPMGMVIGVPFQVAEEATAYGPLLHRLLDRWEAEGRDVVIQLWKNHWMPILRAPLTSDERTPNQDLRFFLIYGNVRLIHRLTRILRPADREALTRAPAFWGVAEGDVRALTPDELSRGVRDLKARVELLPSGLRPLPPFISELIIWNNFQLSAHSIEAMLDRGLIRNIYEFDPRHGRTAHGVMKAIRNTPHDSAAVERLIGRLRWHGMPRWRGESWIFFPFHLRSALISGYHQSISYFLDVALKSPAAGGMEEFAITLLHALGGRKAYLQYPYESALYGPTRWPSVAELLSLPHTRTWDRFREVAKSYGYPLELEPVRKDWSEWPPEAEACNNAMTKR